MAWRFSVRVRLLVVFGAAALFAVIASVMGLGAFESVDRAQRAILTERLPTVTTAQELANLAQQVAAMAPLLEAAPTHAERQTAGQRLADQFRDLNTLILRLRDTDLDPAILDQLAEHLLILQETTDTMNTWVATRIDTEREMDVGLNTARGLLTGLTANLENLYARATAGTTADDDGMAATAPNRPRSEALNASLRAAYKAAVALEASANTEAGRLQQAETSFLAALAMLDRYISSDRDTDPRRESIRKVVARLTAMGSSADSLFALRGRYLEAQRRAHSLLVAYSQFANRMVYAARTGVTDTTRAMTAFGDSLVRDLRLTSMALMLIAGLSIGGALLLAIFADRTISGRLVELRESMDRHARGERGSLPAIYDDEIGDMSRALRVFVETIDSRESALKASEDHLRTVIDTVPEGILTVDSDGRVVSASRSAEALFKRPADKLTGMPLSALMTAPEPDQPDPCTPAALSRAGAQGDLRAVMGWRPDATCFPAELTVGRPAEGTRGLWVLSLRDTTERQRTEAERERYVALLSAAQEATDYGLMVSDLDGEIIMANRKFYEAYGTDYDEMITLRRPQRMKLLGANLADPETFFRNIAHADTNPERTTEDIIPLADGRLLERYTAPFRVAGALAGRIWSVRDITEREHARRDLTEAKDAAEKALLELKDAQRNLVEAEKMAALGQLVAGVAHEINTPIGIAVTAASHIADEAKEVQRLVEAGEIKRSRFQSFLKTTATSAALLLSNTHRASELIQSFKQVAVDQTSDERRRFDLATYIKEVLISLGPRLRKSPHVVDVQCPDNLIVDGYPGAFSQVLTNMVINALTHAFEGQEQGGILRVRVAALDGDRIEMRFIDDGRGMPADVREQVFEPFFTTRRGKGGTGLGLHIVYNIVTRTLGGRIRVDSTPNHGTTFTLTFPRVAPTPPATDGNVPASAPERVTRRAPDRVPEGETGAESRLKTDAAEGPDALPPPERPLPRTPPPPAVLRET